MTALQYAYAILALEDAANIGEPLGNMAGINGAGVTFVAVGGLAAAVSAVPLAEFSTEPLNRLVANLDWLAPRAAAHQQVCALLFAQTEALLPLAFGTVYQDTVGIEHMLQREHDRLSAHLADVRSRGEWVLSLQRDMEQAHAALEQHNAALQSLRAQIAASTPGRAYLLSRQVETLRRRELLAQDSEAIAAVEQLYPLTARAYVEPLPSEGQGGLLRRVSVLVERRHEAQWLTATDALRRQWEPRGYDLRITGPWPAYRFSSREAQSLAY